MVAVIAGSAHSALDRPELMGDHVLRFAVGDPFGTRAATWRVWSPAGRGKNDVYIACRSLGRVLKTSLHESGSWHVGFLRSYVEKHFDAGDPKQTNPYLQRWPRPQEIGPGVTLAYRIVVLPAAVNRICQPESAHITWLPAPPMGRAVEIAILLVEARANVEHCPGSRSIGTSPVGSYVLDSGVTIWVVHRQIDSPTVNMPGQGNTTWLSGKGPANLNEPGVAGLIFGDTEDGSRVILEVGVSSSSIAI
ncbi:hypothetical protein ICNINCKA_00189 [Synechococcus sp. CBW1107]|nr:hypothetical protein ICNINCKA_00189 [Synechococcus sp. CBW1107]